MAGGKCRKSNPMASTVQGGGAETSPGVRSGHGRRPRPRDVSRPAGLARTASVVIERNAFFVPGAALSRGNGIPGVLPYRRDSGGSGDRRPGAVTRFGREAARCAFSAARLQAETIGAGARRGSRHSQQAGPGRAARASAVSASCSASPSRPPAKTCRAAPRTAGRVRFAAGRFQGRRTRRGLKVNGWGTVFRRKRLSVPSCRLRRCSLTARCSPESARSGNPRYRSCGRLRRPGAASGKGNGGCCNRGAIPYSRCRNQ